MDFDSFPNEILEKIALYLDGVTLFRAKQTCKRWINVIEYAETSLNVWKRLCVREMSVDLLAELVGFKDRIDDDRFDYRDVYIKYHRQRSLKKKSDYLLTHFPFSEESSVDNGLGCTCVRVKGDGLLTGHRNGTVMLWNIQTGLLVDTVAKHMRQVTALVFLDCFVRGLSSSSHYFLTASKDRTLKCVSSLFHNDQSDIYFSSYVKTIRVFGNKIAVLCERGQIILFEIILREKLQLEKLFEVPPIGPNGPRCNWMSFWNNTLTCISSSIDCYTSKLGDLMWSCHPPSLVEEDDKVVSGDVVAVSGYLFRRNIKILITVDRYLLISSDGHRYRRYSTLKDLKGVVTSVAISGNLLALGTDIGRLFLYHFKTDSDLMNLQLDRPSWSEEANIRDAIVAIDIKLDAREPLIVAANRNEVFIVRFVVPAAKKKETGLELSRKYLDSLFITCK